ncbi:MAG: DNA repair protein RadC [Clostridia bacterium]|nr:DNA repair protein RadC [Clostridia bacterium]
MENNIHKGHRDRLRSEFLSYSDSSKMPEHKLLEMLLFYGIPQRDTNEIAHSLIQKFGTFHGVFDADVTEIKNVKGMTANAATLVKLILPIARAYVSSRYDDELVLKNTRDIGTFLLKKYFAQSVEKCSLICLNHSGKILSFDFISEGNVDSTAFSIRTIVERAVSVGATDIVLAHNHPGGVPLPSKEDIAITAAVANALKVLDIKFVDHIIIADDDYISLAKSSGYSELFY